MPGSMVIPVAAETSQLSVVRCPVLISAGLAAKELIVGGISSDVDAGFSLTMVTQPAVEPIKTASDMAISVNCNLYFIIQASGFCWHYRCGWKTVSNKIKNQRLKIKMVSKNAEFNTGGSQREGGKHSYVSPACGSFLGGDGSPVGR